MGRHQSEPHRTQEKGAGSKRRGRYHLKAPKVNGLSVLLEASVGNLLVQRESKAGSNLNLLPISQNEMILK